MHNSSSSKSYACTPVARVLTNEAQAVQRFAGALEASCQMLQSITAGILSSDGGSVPENRGAEAGITHRE
jgi:hypothetical protein